MKSRFVTECRLLVLAFLVLVPSGAGVEAVETVDLEHGPRDGAAVPDDVEGSADVVEVARPPVAGEEESLEGAKTSEDLIPRSNPPLRYAEIQSDDSEIESAVLFWRGRGDWFDASNWVFGGHWRRNVVATGSRHLRSIEYRS